MNIKYSSNLKLIKDNLPIIILLPTLLGGAWQLIELSMISFSFIRFFSTSQIIPDGIIILPIFITIYIAHQIINFKQKSESPGKETSESPHKIRIEKPKNYKYSLNPNKSNKIIYKNNSNCNKNNVVFIIIFLLIISIMIYIVYYLDKNYLGILHNLKNDFNYMSLLFVSLFLFMILSLYKKALGILLICFLKKYGPKIDAYFKDKPILKELALAPLGFLVAWFFVFFIIVIISIASFFHNAVSLPSNFINLKQIEASFEKENFKNSKILYFNDKYIFVEHKQCSGEKTIQVIKFDNLFKNN